MQTNKYDKTLYLDYWFATKKDLQKLFDWLKQRMHDGDVYIKLEVDSGNNKEYDNFDEFSQGIEDAIEKKDCVQQIILRGSSTFAIKNQNRKYIFITSDFRYSNKLRINISAEDVDGSNKDWVVGTYEEINEIFKSFQYEEAFIRIVNKKYLKTSSSRSILIFDYKGEKIKEINDEKEKIAKENQNSNKEVKLKNKHLTWKSFTKYIPWSIIIYLIGEFFFTGKTPWIVIQIFSIFN